MCGHHHGGAGAVDAVEQLHDPDAGGGVEVSGGLVGDQDRRTVDERTSDGNALLLTTGQLAGVAVFFAGQTDELDHLRDDLGDQVARASGHLEGEGHVLVDGLVGEQPEVLEDGADLAAQLGHLPVREPGDVLAGDVDRALRRPLLAQDQSQQGRLARTRGPDQEDELALVDLERDVVERWPRLARIDLGDVVQPDHGVARPGRGQGKRASVRPGPCTTGRHQSTGAAMPAWSPAPVRVAMRHVARHARLSKESTKGRGSESRTPSVARRVSD